MGENQRSLMKDQSMNWGSQLNLKKGQSSLNRDAEGGGGGKGVSSADETGVEGVKRGFEGFWGKLRWVVLATPFISSALLCSALLCSALL